MLGWVLLPALVGLPAAVLWWLCAPGGALYGSGHDPMTWLPRDLVFAAIGLCAGIVIGAMAVLRGRRDLTTVRIAAAVAGSAAGSLIAWQAGQWLGRTLTDTGAGTDVAQMSFSLLGLGALGIWPAAVAATGCLVMLAALLRSRG